MPTSEYYRTHREYCIKKTAEWKLANPEKHNEQKARARFRNRNKILAHYGEECACCRETRKEFLSIDHIHGGGNKHRREIKRNGNHFYGWLIKNNYPEGFRTLCHNCNASYGYYGYCPHEKERQLNRAVEASQVQGCEVTDNENPSLELCVLHPLCAEKVADGVTSTSPTTSTALLNCLLGADNP